MSGVNLYTTVKNPGAFSGFTTFKKNQIIKLEKNIEDIKKLKSYVLHKPIRKKFQRRKVFVPFINYQWVADLVDVQKLSRQNKGVRYILLVIDAFSKKLYFAFLKDKTAISTLNGLKRIFRESGIVPKYLQTDKSKEFENLEVQNYLKSLNIDWFHTYTKIKASIVEIVFRTIMTKQARYFSHSGHQKYTEVFADIVESYNSTYHLSIKMKPNDVSLNNKVSVRP